MQPDQPTPQPKPQTLAGLDVTHLKALAFDLTVARDQAAARLQAVLRELAGRQQIAPTK